MAMIFAMLIWGLSWSNGKIAGQYADPQLLMFWRFTFAAMTMVPTMLFLGIKPTFKQKAIPLLLVAAIFMVLYNYMYFKGTQIGQAGLGGVITTSLNPVITTILVVLLFKHTIQQKEIVGILMGIFGGLILIKIWSVDIYQLFNSGNIYFVFGAVLWAIVTLLTQKAKSDMNVVTFSFWMYSISIVIAYPFAAEYSILSVFSFDWIFWINFLSLSIGSLAFATSIYFFAAMELGSQKASSFTFMVPAAAMIFAMIILGEKLELNTLIGGGMAISAVYLINRK